MKLRTVALALTLACGFTASVEAKQKAQKVKVKHHKHKTHKVKRYRGV